MESQQSKLLTINREFAGLVSEARSVGGAVQPGNGPNTGGAGRDGDPVALLFQPSELYGRAAAKLKTSGPDNDSDERGDIARGIRMTAAKIRAGDRGYVFEALTGQAVWLQALALHLGDVATTMQDNGRKVALCRLLLKVQAASAKTLASVAALSAFEGR